MWGKYDQVYAQADRYGPADAAYNHFSAVCTGAHYAGKSFPLWAHECWTDPEQAGWDGTGWSDPDPVYPVYGECAARRFRKRNLPVLRCPDQYGAEHGDLQFLPHRRHSGAAGLAGGTAAGDYGRTEPGEIPGRILYRILNPGRMRAELRIPDFPSVYVLL